MQKTPQRIGRIVSWKALACFGLGLSVVCWPRSGTAVNEGEAIPSASSLASTSPSSFHLRSTNSSVRNRSQEEDLASDMEQPMSKLRAAFLAAQAIEHPGEQGAAFSHCFENLTSEMAAALLANLNADDLKGVAAQRLFDHWATACPREAASWALELHDPETCRSFLQVAAARWAVMDLREAASWGRRLSDVLTAVASEALRSEPIEALQLAAELPPGTEQADLVCRAAAEWAVTDRDSALKWATQIKDPALLQRVIEQIAIASAERDPMAAAALAVDGMSLGIDQDRVILSIVARWVQTAPEAASAWVSQFPEDSLGSHAMADLITLWADQDLAAPGQWLLTLPAGVLRDAGTLAYSQVMRRTDAAMADRWALLTDSGP
jgi:hypothetical protein